MTDSSVASGTYTILLTPEQVATPIFTPPEGTFSSAQSVSISCTTSGATIRYTTNGVDPASSSTVYSGPISVSTGLVTIKARAFMSGWTDSDVASATYTIESPGQIGTPTASFTSSPSLPKVGVTVTFDASVSSASNGMIVDYVWNFGDGNTANGNPITHTYTTPGTYTITLTVTDNDEQTDTTTKTIQITDEVIPPEDDEDVTPPVAYAGNDMTVETGSIVTFDADGSSDDTGIVSYEWDFGDGTTGTGVTTSHTYPMNGNYDVTLRVADAAGNFRIDTLMINVANSADPTPLWILIPIVGGVAGATFSVVYLKRRKPK